MGVWRALLCLAFTGESLTTVTRGSPPTAAQFSRGDPFINLEIEGTIPIGPAWGILLSAEASGEVNKNGGAKLEAVLSAGGNIDFFSWLSLSISVKGSLSIEAEELPAVQGGMTKKLAALFSQATKRICSDTMNSKEATAAVFASLADTQPIPFDSVQEVVDFVAGLRAPQVKDCLECDPRARYSQEYVNLYTNYVVEMTEKVKKLPDDRDTLFAFLVEMFKTAPEKYFFGGKDPENGCFLLPASSDWQVNYLGEQQLSYPRLFCYLISLNPTIQQKAMAAFPQLNEEERHHFYDYTNVHPDERILLEQYHTALKSGDPSLIEVSKSAALLRQSSPIESDGLFSSKKLNPSKAAIALTYTKDGKPLWDAVQAAWKAKEPVFKIRNIILENWSPSAFYNMIHFQSPTEMGSSWTTLDTNLRTIEQTLGAVDKWQEQNVPLDYEGSLMLVGNLHWGLTTKRAVEVEAGVGSKRSGTMGVASTVKKQTIAMAKVHVEQQWKMYEKSYGVELELEFEFNYERGTPPGTKLVDKTGFTWKVSVALDGLPMQSALQLYGSLKQGYAALQSFFQQQDTSTASSKAIPKREQFVKFIKDASDKIQAVIRLNPVSLGDQDLSDEAPIPDEEEDVDTTVVKYRPWTLLEIGYEDGEFAVDLVVLRRLEVEIPVGGIKIKVSKGTRKPIFGRKLDNWYDEENPDLVLFNSGENVRCKICADMVKDLFQSTKPPSKFLLKDPPPVWDEASECETLVAQRKDRMMTDVDFKSLCRGVMNEVKLVMRTAADTGLKTTLLDDAKAMVANEATTPKFFSKDCPKVAPEHTAQIELCSRCKGCAWSFTEGCVVSNVKENATKPVPFPCSYCTGRIVNGDVIPSTINAEQTVSFQGACDPIARAYKFCQDTRISCLTPREEEEDAAESEEETPVTRPRSNAITRRPRHHRRRHRKHHKHQHHRHHKQHQHK